MEKPQHDPAETAKLFAEVAERSSKLMAEFMQRHAEGKSAPVTDEFGIAKAFMDLSASMLADPWKLAGAQMKMFSDYVSLWQASTLKMLGQSAPAVAEPVKGDNRFRDADWQDNFLFDYLKQSYLIAARHIHDSVGAAEGLPEETRKKVNFFTRQYLDALSPSNFAMTNPQVMRETLNSGGQNLIKGLNNLLSDLDKGDGQLKITMSDASAFKVGHNVATTPGKVVFQTDLMQLIQYDPLTPDVSRRPLLIIPPWINKYYILDLRDKNSFIRWAVAQGHTVFVISWVNPDERFAAKGFDDYMFEGPLAALEAIEKATGERELNVIGYCLGGTLLGATLAWIKAHAAGVPATGDAVSASSRHPAGYWDGRIKSATFFVALLDFSIPGDLGVFIDEQQIAGLERRMNERGYLEGSEMATTFNMLRSNDLIWSFVINNYLLGKEPFPFDLLYWNADSTRMPAAMHSFYLRNMYLGNKLKDPGGITLGGLPIDLRRIDVPAYFVSTAEDHIALWKSTYKGARLLAGAQARAGEGARPARKGAKAAKAAIAAAVAHPVRFVLGGSGHIAGIVNPPDANKYGYWTNPDLVESPEDWQAGAVYQTGSWWLDWQRWIAALNGPDRAPARVPGKGRLKVLENAPGSYASVRL